MRPQKRNSTSLQSLVEKGLERAGYLSEDKATRLKFVHLVRSVWDKRKGGDGGDWDKRYPNGPTVRFFENIAILKIKFGFVNEDIYRWISDDFSYISHVVKLRKKEVGLLADAYEAACHEFPALEELLNSKKKFEELSLCDIEMSSKLHPFEQELGRKVPMHLAKALEQIRWGDGFQDGEPDAVCLAAEKYMAAGAVDIAGILIDQVLEQHPNHPGGWFHKTRILLRQSAALLNEASYYHVLSDEADTMSAAERHYEDLSGDTVEHALTLRENAFEVCLKAFELLPDEKEYMNAARKWSESHTSYMEIRQAVLLFIVGEAGRKCNPYRGVSSALHDKIEARLERCKKLLRCAPADGEVSTYEWVTDYDKIAELKELPLFSDKIDQLLLQSYQEIMGSYFFHGDKTVLQLAALNFIRVLAPHEDYKQEVLDLVERLRGGYGETTSKYFGFYDADDPTFSWRTVLHEHLDAVMSRENQRALVCDIYQKHVSEVLNRRDDALRAICDDELRRLCEAKLPQQAFEVAKQAEHDGVYRRDDGYSALVLLRMAEAAAMEQRVQGSDVSDVADYLEDQDLVACAQDFYEKALSDWDPLNGGEAVPLFLIPGESFT